MWTWPSMTAPATPKQAASGRASFEPFRKVVEDLLEGGVVAALEGLLADRPEGVAGGLEEGEDGLRPADVAGQDHGEFSFANDPERG